MSRTLQIDPDRVIRTLDQTRLPFERREIRLTDAAACHEAIVAMAVRGAPLIGAVAAFGLAFSLREDPSDAALLQARDWLASARPTAVNLAWALDRVARSVAGLAPERRAEAAWRESLQLCEEDVTCNEAIGAHGARLLLELPAARAGRTINILTHCNAGRIATVDHGTALAPVYALQRAGVGVHVWVDETRPRNQGASLTAWELAEAGIPHTVIADNAGGLLMMRGEVDAVITGCDRVAANGDVANKIGTYLKALAAHDNRLPFWVACPISSIDPATADGASIRIEDRSADEVTHVQGWLDEGRPARVRVVPDGSPVANPAFDVTPARLVTALVTERGVIAASHAGLRSAGIAGGTTGSLSTLQQIDAGSTDARVPGVSA
jgi:methylthioribose-1-phosphate isomerase